jgi:hypothetical protein
MCGSHDIEQAVMSASRDRSAAKFRDKSSVTGGGRKADFCTITAYWGRFKKTWPKVDLLGLRGKEPVHAGGDAIVAVLIAMLLADVQAAREAARPIQRSSNRNQLALPWPTTRLPSARVPRQNNGNSCPVSRLIPALVRSSRCCRTSSGRPFSRHSTSVWQFSKMCT